MLASDVITSARYTLSDTGAVRWTDYRLMSLINECLQEIALKTILFNDTMFMGISNNVVDYDLSTYLTKITRIEYLDKPLPFVSFQAMDNGPGSGSSKGYNGYLNLDNYSEGCSFESCGGNRDWQLHIGTSPKAIVYDKQRPGQFKIYPIVQNAENRYLVYSSDYGIITGITYSDIQELVTNTYGDLGTLVNTGYLKIYGIMKQAPITNISTPILLDDSILPMIAHYVVGRALRDNTDIQNRQMAAEELAMYQTSIDAYTAEKEKGYMQAQHQARYIPS